MVQAFIFDVDGTLVDSVDAHAKAWREGFAEFGHEIAYATMRYQIGKGSDQILPVFVDEAEVATVGKCISERRAEIFRTKYKPHIKAFEGVRALFERLHKDNLRLLLASSARDHDLSDYVRLADIGDLIEGATSSDDAERSKPHPDIFEAAMKRLDGVPRHDIVVVGDTPYDAEAATKAGVRCVGMLCGGFPEADLRRAGCVDIFDDPSGMLRHYDRLMRLA